MTQKIADDCAAIAQRMAEIKQERQEQLNLEAMKAASDEAKAKMDPFSIEPIVTTDTTG